jgi:hypothetical protein
LSSDEGGVKDKDTPPKFSDLAQLSKDQCDLQRIGNIKVDAVVTLLGVLCDSNDDIVKYKKEQKEGDIRFRKKSDVSSKLSITIALAALSISIKGVDYFVDAFMRLL